MDVYSFRSEFEKLYMKDTPKKMLSNLLKHNHLANPALAMVNSLDDIDEIWKRLRKAFGDPKTILSNLLSDVKQMGPIWKLKGNEDRKEGLVNLINAITDLTKLAKKHDIEAKLYNREGLDVIYYLMGDNRVTRWLMSIYDENFEDEALWLRLMEFLQKELVV